MEECLHYIYKSAWKNGEFLKSWKLVNRNVFPKAGKEDYHEASSYLSVSVTPIKRYEHITSKRLLVAINNN